MKISDLFSEDNSEKQTWNHFHIQTLWEASKKVKVSIDSKDSYVIFLSW